MIYILDFRDNNRVFTWQKYWDRGAKKITCEQLKLHAGKKGGKCYTLLFLNVITVYPCVRAQDVIEDFRTQSYD